MIEQLIETYGLAPLPREGGWFRRTHGDQHSSAILYLLTRDSFSSLHRLDGVEIYHFHAGAPVILTLLDQQQGARNILLGNDFASGCRPQQVVPAGTWQGSSTTGEWSLLGTTMAPGYTDDLFTLGERTALIEQYPQAADRIAALTR